MTPRDSGPPWSGLSYRTVTELIDRCCRQEPERPAMIFEDGLVVARGEFLDQAERFAGYLVARTAPGDRIAVMLETRAEFMIALAAALAVRCTLVPMNPGAGDYDAGHVLRDSGAVIAIVDGHGRDLVERLKATCPMLRDIIVLQEPEPMGLAAYATDTGRVRLAGAGARRDDIATIHYTSGTTGMPKGCMLGHDWWLRVCDVHLRMTPHQRDDRHLCCVPFYYVDSLFPLLCILHAGEALVVMRRFSVSRFWQVAHDHRATLVYLIASMPILLLKQAASAIERQHRLRMVVCLAVPAGLHRQLVDRFGVPFLDGYGSTEAGWVTRVPWKHAEASVGSGSMGVAVPECELRVVDEAGRDLPVRREGELLVRAPGLFAGYLNQPEATAAAMRGGWYHTGDLVRVDAAGSYYFIGRKKDIVRRGGENIACAEVEAVLRTHPKVRDAAVIPVADEIRGEEAKACVLLVEGCSADDLPPAEIVAHCAGRLAPFKIPRYIAYQATDFPRTPSMRVRKEDLKAVGDPTAGAWDRERGAWIHERPDTRGREIEAMPANGRRAGSSPDAE
jgi:crotonobetaine/carnitine-CoA ligase